ncbi:unnamed protein product [Closterium sp. NIES-64]|nr:unnamed protein product [Closterium sp. NIES-64]
MTRLPTNLEGDRQYNTALRWAIAASAPQLCRQRSRMHSAISDREQAPLDLYATYDAAIPGGIGPYDYLARLYGYIAFPAWVHTALALPAREMDYTLIRPHYARASASHHGVPAFSFIEYENGSGETVYGRVHLLLRLTNNSEDADPAGEEVAFVRQWYPSQVDECTGCMRMRPSDDELSYDFVPVIAVQRTVHMVESFVTPGLWPDGKPPHGPPLNLTADGNLTADVGAQLTNCTVDQKTLNGSFHLAVLQERERKLQSSGRGGAGGRGGRSARLASDGEGRRVRHRRDGRARAAARRGGLAAARGVVPEARLDAFLENADAATLDALLAVLPTASPPPTSGGGGRNGGGSAGGARNGQGGRRMGRELLMLAFGRAARPGGQKQGGSSSRGERSSRLR